MEEINKMIICNYGCGREATHQFKNGKWCCSKSHRSCPTQRTISSIKMKNKWKDPNSKLKLISKKNRSDIKKKLWRDPDSAYNSVAYRKKVGRKSKKAWRDPNSKLNSISYKEKQKYNTKEAWKNPSSGLNSNLCKEKRSNKMKKKWDDPNSVFNSTSYRNKKSTIMKEAWKDADGVFNPILFRKRMKFTIEKINKKYLLFSKIEEMKYNPNKPGEKEIQVHCKNHNCKNSKEEGGWFTPSGRQITNRIQAIENTKGFEECNFYCSQECKNNCLLYNTKGDPYRSNNKPYTYTELQTYKKFILERNNKVCYYCGECATIVHHLRPKKLEPFFALDPDYGVACCKKCHYKYGHPINSKYSTGNIAKIICSTESQNFLNQQLGGRNMKCGLVIGHKEKRQGACNKKHGVCEYRFNKQLSCDIYDYLKAEGSEINIRIIHRRIYKELPDDINKINPDFFISMHCNAFDGKTNRTETLYYHTSKRSKKLAQVFQKNMVKAFGFKDRGILPRATEDRGGTLLRYTNMPGVIAEPFFIDNDDAYETVMSDYDKLVKAYVDSIEEISRIIGG